jgi:hypothetical protein
MRRYVHTITRMCGARRIHVPRSNRRRGPLSRGTQIIALPPHAVAPSVTTWIDHLCDLAAPTPVCALPRGSSFPPPQPSFKQPKSTLTPTTLFLRQWAPAPPPADPRLFPLRQSRPPSPCRLPPRFRGTPHSAEVQKRHHARHTPGFSRVGRTFVERRLLAPTASAVGLCT